MGIRQEEDGRPLRFSPCVFERPLRMTFAPSEPAGPARKWLFLKPYKWLFIALRIDFDRIPAPRAVNHAAFHNHPGPRLAPNATLQLTFAPQAEPSKPPFSTVN